MSFDALKTEILAARDRRHQAWLAALEGGATSLVMLSMNLPGPDKSPAGASALFAWGELSLRGIFVDLAPLGRETDALGPYALFGGDLHPVFAKLRCIALEESCPATRLLDLDVYDAWGRAMDRALLQLPQRDCLVCDQPARTCMAAGRHSQLDLERTVHELLAPFRP